MDQSITPNPNVDFAAMAFNDLRAEVSLLRRGIERLTDERAGQPDYAPSLAEINGRLDKFYEWATQLAQKPALKTTAKSLADDIQAAASCYRQQDHAMLEGAGKTMVAAASRIDAMFARARSVAEQDREIRMNRIGFAVAGMLVFAILPGAIARSLPVSWAVPERIAARMLGMDMWSAGQNMMAKADRKRWEQIVKRDGQHARRRLVN